MIDFERLFEQSKCKLEKQLENKVIDTKILPHLQCQGKDVVVDDLVKTNKSCFLIGDGGS